MREKLIAVARAKRVRQGIGGKSQGIRDFGKIDFGMVRAHQLTIEANVVDPLGLRQDVSIAVVKRAAAGENQLPMRVVLNRHAQIFVVFDELNLDQVEGNGREPAGQENQNPDGAGAVLHKTKLMDLLLRRRVGRHHRRIEIDRRVWGSPDAGQAGTGILIHANQSHSRIIPWNKGGMHEHEPPRQQLHRLHALEISCQFRVAFPNRIKFFLAMLCLLGQVQILVFADHVAETQTGQQSGDQDPFEDNPSSAATGCFSCGCGSLNDLLVANGDAQAGAAGA